MNKPGKNVFIEYRDRTEPNLLTSKFSDPIEAIVSVYVDTMKPISEEYHFYVGQIVNIDGIESVKTECFIKPLGKSDMVFESCDSMRFEIIRMLGKLYDMGYNVPDINYEVPSKSTRKA